jgi:hypothetical protein
MGSQKPVEIIPMGESPVSGMVETAMLLESYYKQIAVLFGVPVELLESSHTCEKAENSPVLKSENLC